MIATPAVDLRGGRCVQLVGGRPDDERISLPDPPAVARRWNELGFETLHVVDLDAALDSGDNTALIERIVDATRAEIQVGGGVRSEERVGALLDRGVARVVIGTRGLDDPGWLARVCARWPGRIVLALDTREGRILRKGWTEETALLVDEYLPGLADLPLAGILNTDVGREGQLDGIDPDACARTLDASPHPVWISGGITTLAELAWLDEAGAAGAVLGMAIYTETIDVNDVATRWGAAETTRTS